MNRRFRRYVFIIFTVFFVVTSIIIILFAQGYRVGFQSLKIVKTGGIFIKTSTDGAKIYVNDNYVGSTNGILSHTTLISGLTPKNYNVFIYKENYYPWNKSVEINNGMVVELHDIILFPLEPRKIKITELPDQLISEFAINNNAAEIKNNKTKTQKVFSLADGKLLSTNKFKIATSSPTEFVSPDKNKNLFIDNNQLWIEYLDDIKKEPAKNAGEKELITEGEGLEFFNWFSDSEHVIWLAGNELTIAELDNRGGKRNSIKFYLNVAPPVFWDRDNSDLYFFEKSPGKNILYKISFK